jgi:hypothetical protein
MKKTFRTAEQAQEAARAGKIDEAFAALTGFADGGDVAASASLAEIHAFRGEWDAVLLRAAPLLANPAEVYAGNVPADLAGLVGRAAEETKRWKDALAVLGKPSGDEWLLTEEVRRFLKAGGKRPAPRGQTPDPPAHQRKVHQRTAEEARETKDKKLLFLAARGFPLFDAEAVVAFPGARAELDWDETVDAARAFVRQGKPDAAWKAVVPKLGAWTNVERCQIAPCELLHDPDLRRMMTPARCAKVLATPRAA